MNHILIAEDEHLIARLVEMTLTRAGYRCTVAEDGRTAADLIEKTDFDMAILDIMLPGLDGYDLLASLKPQGVPVIFLTAKSAVKDRVLGLRLGADDYITKPFSMRELMARVKTNMRRTVSGEEREKAPLPSGGGLRISKDNGMVYKNGRPLELSAREFDILCFLSAAPGRVFSREELMEQVWGYEYYGDLRAVDVAIRRLREKVEDQPASPRHIMTKRGMGYYFADGE